MAEIKTVMTTVTYNEEQMKRLREIFEPAEFISLKPYDLEGIENALKVADVAVIASDLDERFLNAPTKLKWVHCDHAGLDRSARPEVFEKGLIVTGSAGRSAPALAEHAMYFMLSFTFAFPAFYKAQLAHDFIRDLDFRNSLRCLYGRTLGILGVGNTGKELAVRAKAFQMKVIGFGRTPTTDMPPGVDKMYYAETDGALHEVLKNSDFIVLSLPLSDETYHLIGERELKIMKPSAYLINIARGAIIDEKALIKALYDGEIAGAGLDVFEKEPLLPDSPLWDAPNVIITPHCTPKMPDRTERSLEIIAENVKRYRDGKPMLNRLRREYMFTKQKDTRPFGWGQIAKYEGGKLKE